MSLYCIVVVVVVVCYRNDLSALYIHTINSTVLDFHSGTVVCLKLGVMDVVSM